MKYPAICNWVYCSKTENGSYIVYDEVSDEKYRMSARGYDFFRRLDGKTNPSKIKSDLSREQRQRMLAYLEKELLIRKSRILSFSLGCIMITLFPIKNGGTSRKTIATVADRVLSLLWLPVLLTSVFYMANHYKWPSSSGGIVSGSIVGMIVGILLHELAHGAACLRYNGKIYEFGIGFQFFFPAAYVLMSTTEVKSRWKRGHIYAAGVEANLLLTSIGLYLSCFFPEHGLFFMFVAIQNGMLALFNLVFFSKDIDGIGIMSEYIGCNNLFEYARETIVSRERRRKLYHSGVNGLVTLGVCCVALLMQIGFLLFIVLNLGLLII